MSDYPTHCSACGESLTDHTSLKCINTLVAKLDTEKKAADAALHAFEEVQAENDALRSRLSSIQLAAVEYHQAPPTWEDEQKAYERLREAIFGPTRSQTIYSGPVVEKRPSVPELIESAYEVIQKNQKPAPERTYDPAFAVETRDALLDATCEHGKKVREWCDECEKGSRHRRSGVENQMPFITREEIERAALEPLSLKDTLGE